MDLHIPTWALYSQVPNHELKGFECDIRINPFNKIYQKSLLEIAHRDKLFFCYSYIKNIFGFGFMSIQAKSDDPKKLAPLIKYIEDNFKPR